MKAQYKQHTTITETEYQDMMNIEPNKKSIVKLSDFVASRLQYVIDKVSQPKRQPKERNICQSYMYDKGKNISELLQKIEILPQNDVLH